jgi:hypothetical protein
VEAEWIYTSAWTSCDLYSAELYVGDEAAVTMAGATVTTEKTIGLRTSMAYGGYMWTTLMYACNIKPP